MNMNTKFYRDEWIVEHKGALYMPMIETADIVAKRYGISREKQDEYALESQQRTAAAQKAGTLRRRDRAHDHRSWRSRTRRRKEISKRTVTLEKDEGNRPDTTLEGLAKLKPVRGDGQFITAGNASQLSDGASACVLMSDKEAAKRRLKPLGIYRGLAVAGCEPDEMGIGPVFAVPRLLAAHRPQDGRHRPVGAQRGVRRAGASTAATSSASRRSSSTSTAAPSPSATPTA